jgi:hypothetical protein
MNRLALAVFALALAGCSANSPFYVSGITAGVDTSKDGIGGQVALTIVPNPAYKLPHMPK